MAGRTPRPEGRRLKGYIIPLRFSCRDGVHCVQRCLRSHQHRRRQRRPRLRAARGRVRRKDRRHRIGTARRHLCERRLCSQEGDVERGRHRNGPGRCRGLRLRDRHGRRGGRQRLAGAEEKARCVRRALERHVCAQPRGQRRRVHRGSGKISGRAHAGRERCAAQRGARGDRHRRLRGRAAPAGRRARHHLGRLFRARNSSAARGGGRQRLHRLRARLGVSGARQRHAAVHPQGSPADALRPDARQIADAGNARRRTRDPHRHCAECSRRAVRTQDAGGGRRARVPGLRLCPLGHRPIGRRGGPRSARRGPCGRRERIRGDRRFPEHRGRGRVCHRRRDRARRAHACGDRRGQATQRSPVRWQARPAPRLRSDPDRGVHPPAHRHGGPARERRARGSAMRSRCTSPISRRCITRSPRARCTPT